MLGIEAVPVMCILFLHTDNNAAPDKFRLILASNRDEYYKRPTRQAHIWEEDPTVIGGRDLEPGREGGSWLVLSTKGRIAVLLNVTGENIKDPSTKIGRGFLAVDFVTNKEQKTQEEYHEKISLHGYKYSPFSLVTIDISSENINVQQYSNASGSKDHAENVGSGPRGWGNCLLDNPFRKVTVGTSRFKEVVETYGTKENKDKLIQELLVLLKWEKSHFPDPVLQQRLKQLTPSVIEKTSSVFINIPERGYGTRTHSIILIDGDGKIDFMEWTMEEPIDPQNPSWTSIKFSSQLMNH
ncbi:hypothetical protein ANN_07176 [Periplaneta americana]|uniref:Transport and Golgi organization protein 2 homolog n=1 Tax=Periplaneta americana TaxID=6978 RepID=A0ABQ8TGX1_PERAM|nr:hypothetical protein ANN_07176 [Periplaneta americana]